jgi:hypothetical protein
MKTTIVVVPWHKEEQKDLFLKAWQIPADYPSLLMVWDRENQGCARTKNYGIAVARDSGADVIIVLDDDCYPYDLGFDDFISAHVNALRPQHIGMFETVTDPPSRGTPYFNKTIEMPVAASMGFWRGIGDYDAPGQLVYGAENSMAFERKTIYGKYFPLCGMNLAFRATEWPWCQFVNVPRFDDIWQGFLWQKHAYASGKCFNLAGPLVTHSRQSDVWQNLRIEAENLERNETIWQAIHRMPLLSHPKMLESLHLTL